MKYDAVVVAAGKGQRAALGYNKVFFRLKNGKTVIEESCHLFVEDEDCNSIIIVTDEKLPFVIAKAIVVEGGKQRKDSVINGLHKVKSDYVFIHDGARPFLSKEELENTKKAVFEYDAALLATKAIDTIKKEKDGFVEETIDRNIIWQASTPQAFKTSLIKEAYARCSSSCTDDASVAEMAGIKVKLVEGRKSNIKLTNPEDFKNI